MPNDFALCSFFAALFVLGTASAQTDRTPLPVPGKVEWRSIGPGQFGAMFGVAFSPHDSNMIVAGGDMGNAFLTRDAGSNWEILGRSGPSLFGNPGYRGMWGVHFDPKRPERFWIGSTHGLFRTTDGGKASGDVLGLLPAGDLQDGGWRGNLARAAQPRDRLGEIARLRRPGDLVAAAEAQQQLRAELLQRLRAGQRSRLLGHRPRRRRLHRQRWHRRQLRRRQPLDRTRF